jgi:hypothetical protein
MVYLLGSLIGLGILICFGALAYCTRELGKIPRQVMSQIKVGKEAIRDKINK